MRIRSSPRRSDGEIPLGICAPWLEQRESQRLETPVLAIKAYSRCLQPCLGESPPLCAGDIRKIKWFYFDIN